MPETFLFFQDLGLALLMGGLIGLERERNHGQTEPVHAFGGLRTMALVSLYGFLAYRLFFDHLFLFVLFTAAYFSLVIASYVISSLQNKNLGATTELAGFFVYMIGLLVGRGGVGELYATVITLVLVLILYFKQPLHRFAHRLGKTELYDTLKFIAVVFVILPLLPNRSYGPLDIFNPYEVWFVVVLICSISFASYVGIKLLGPKKGIGLGGFLGGLISSTAVTLSFSALSKKSQKLVNPFIFGLLLAASAMFIRVLFTVLVLHPALLEQLLIPLLAMTLCGFALATYFWFQKKEPFSDVLSLQELPLKSPFQLSTAIQFALIFSVLLFASKFAAVSFGELGLYLTAFFSGTFDVDAITVSMTHLAQDGSISNSMAAMGVLIVVMTNTLSKGFIALFLASRQVGLRVLLSMILVVLVGWASALIPVSYGAFAL
ncbi:MgtC/SapB family protein [Candidatus Peregrinibacteria bacterium]|nr:MAG: MgtC/SapB family protein [Candidatus Peregrinibacteria bacterium]